MDDYDDLPAGLKKQTSPHIDPMFTIDPAIHASSRAYT
jgi:hypothetical protein